MGRLKGCGGSRKRNASLPKGDWTDLLGADVDDRPARRMDADRAVEQRRRMKRLEDCELPEGFRLVTPAPKQMVMEGQLRWAFCLAWRPGVTARGNDGTVLPAGDSFYATYRYEMDLADEVQMQWALGEFERELREAGYTPKRVRKMEPQFGSREDAAAQAASRRARMVLEGSAGQRADGWMAGQAWLQ